MLKSSREPPSGRFGQPWFPGGINERVMRQGERGIDGISVTHSAPMLGRWVPGYLRVRAPTEIPQVRASATFPTGFPQTKTAFPGTRRHTC
jgi:hypothetical protein